MTILIDKTHPLGSAYVELLDNGKIKAGLGKDATSVYDNASVAYDRFRSISDTNHGAWNVCYTIENSDEIGWKTDVVN